MKTTKTKIFYSVEDGFPPYRVDVAELFGRTLVEMGAEVEWYMRRAKPGGAGVCRFGEQNVHLPYMSARKGMFGKIINKLSFWFFDAAHLLRCLGKPIDIIQVRDKYIAAVIGLIVARIKRVPFVYWCSYPFPEHYLERAKTAGSLMRIYCSLHGRIGGWVLYKFVMNRSDHVFVQSRQMQHDIESYGVPARKMTPVPMGVPPRLLNWTATHPVPVVPGRVVYLGTMAEVRQLHVLIDAFAMVRARCPQAGLLMVGEGDHAHERPALERRTESLGLAGAIRFTGFVPIEEAWSYAASAAVCISPFFPTKVLASTSPTKLVEYLAMGRPVVCNDHPEQSDIIVESNAGICVAWGANEFAEAIVRLLQHPEEAEAMGAKGPAWVAANRTYPIIAETVWRRYGTLLGTPR